MKLPNTDIDAVTPTPQPATLSDAELAVIRKDAERFYGMTRIVRMQYSGSQSDDLEKLQLLATLDTTRQERDAAVQELAELKEATRWIPVTERLPEEYAHVWIYKHRVQKGEYVNGRFWGLLSGERLGTAEPTTHWKPRAFPSPPITPPTAGEGETNAS